MTGDLFAEPDDGRLTVEKMRSWWDGHQLLFYRRRNREAFLCRRNMAWIVGLTEVYVDHTVHRFDRFRTACMAVREWVS